MKKNYLFILMTALSFMTGSSFAQETICIYDEPDVSTPFYYLSTNGKYATGEYEGAVMVYEIETGKEYPFYDESNAGAALKCVANDGVAAGQFGIDLDGTAALYDKGEWEMLSVPEGFNDTGSTVVCMTSDRKALVGWASDGMYKPCLWTMQEDGSYKPEILPYPEKDLWGTKPQQVTCWGISDDASVICGRYNDFTGFRWFPILWTRGEDGSYTAKILCEDILIHKDAENPGPQPEWEEWLGDRTPTEELSNEFNDIIMEWNRKSEEYCPLDKKLFMTSKTISPNGEYLVFAMGETSYHFDLTTDTRTVLAVTGGMPTGVTDDNTIIFAGSVLAGAAGLILPAGAGQPSTIAEYLKTNYDLEIDAPIGNPRISNDGKTIIAYSTPDMITFQNLVIRLDVPDSVEDLQQHGTIGIYNNQLQIAGGEGEVMISDLTGKRVYHTKTNAVLTNLSFLPKGLYVVKAAAGNETLVQKIAIK